MDIIDFLRQIAAHRAEQAEVAVNGLVVREPNAVLKRAPARQSVQGMPVYERAWSEGVAAPIVTDRVQHGEPVHPNLLQGLSPFEIVDAYKVGTFMREDPAESEAIRAEMLRRPDVQVSPDMVFQMGQPGDPRGPDPRAVPGTRMHPVEQKWGRTDDIVRELGNRYVTPMFDRPDGTPMSHAEAVQMIAGQLAARRMRGLGSQDPSLGQALGAETWAAMPIGPTL